MTKQRLIWVFILGLTILFVGLPGCSSKKKVVIEQKQTPKTPEKPDPQPQVAEIQKKIEVVEEKPSIPKNLKFGTVYFDFDKSNIRSDQQPTLKSNAQLMSQYESITITIEGHCDERGTNEYNLALGQRRADAVKDYLADFGISRSRISTISFGEERPVDNGHNETSWAKNRRSEFIIVSPKLSSRE